MLTTAHAQDIVTMKCNAVPEKHPITGEALKPCGFTVQVGIGPTMSSHAVDGYCRSCKEFVSIRWTNINSPTNDLQKEIVLRPKPLGEIWDPQTGAFVTIESCPKCTRPFLEIKKISEIKHCPACNKPHFEIDPTKGHIIAD